MQDCINQSAFEAMLKLQVAAAATDIAKTPYIIVPEGIKSLNLEENMPAPVRVRKKVKFTDTQSFVGYFNAFKDGYKPQLFTAGNGTGMQILCVFDYDEPQGSPRWNQHQATLTLAYHPDYASLKKAENSWFSQGDFALFVEENLHLFTSPDAATMLELAQELKGHRNVGWQSGRRLSNGQTKLEYTEELSGKSSRGDVDVPEYLLMKTPIFDGYSEQEIRAAFRWRLDDGGKIFFSYRLLTKVAERKAVDEVKAQVTAQTALPLYAVSGFEGIIS